MTKPDLPKITDGTLYRVFAPKLKITTDDPAKKAVIQALVDTNNELHYELLQKLRSESALHPNHDES